MTGVHLPPQTADDPVPALIRAVWAGPAADRLRAAKALSQIGQPALATLIAHLQHTDPFVRGESALALGWMGGAAKAAVAYLAKVVRGSLQPGRRAPYQPVGVNDSATVTPLTPPP